MSKLNFVINNLLMRPRCSCKTCNHKYRHQCNSFRKATRCPCCGFDHASYSTKRIFKKFMSYWNADDLKSGETN